MEHRRAQCSELRGDVVFKVTWQRQQESTADEGVRPTLLCGFLDFTGPDAGRANAETAAGAVYNRAHTLQVQVPAALGNIVGVADAVAELRPAATHFANSCHKIVLIVAVPAVFPQHAIQV